MQNLAVLPSSCTSATCTLRGDCGETRVEGAEEHQPEMGGVLAIYRQRQFLSISDRERFHTSPRHAIVGCLQFACSADRSPPGLARSQRRRRPVSAKRSCSHSGRCARRSFALLPRRARPRTYRSFRRTTRFAGWSGCAELALTRTRPYRRRASPDRRPRPRRGRTAADVSAPAASARSCAGPVTRVSDQTSFLGASSGLDHRPAEVPAALDVEAHFQPEPVGLAERVLVELAPFGAEEVGPCGTRSLPSCSAPPASQISAPPKPLAAISSRSRVMAALVTLPLSHHQYARSRACAADWRSRLVVTPAGAFRLDALAGTLQNQGTCNEPLRLPRIPPESSPRHLKTLIPMLVKPDCFSRVASPRPWP